MSILAGAAGALIPVLAKSGAGILADVVRSKSPAAATVVERVGAALGEPAATPERIAARYEADPDGVAATIRAVEAEDPEKWRTIAGADKIRGETFGREHEEGLFAWAWRPGWMYLLGALWIWAAVAVALRLPSIDFGTLLTLTGIYTGLYMGGHTAKKVMDAKGGLK